MPQQRSRAPQLRLSTAKINKKFLKKKKTFSECEICPSESSSAVLGSSILCFQTSTTVQKFSFYTPSQRSPLTLLSTHLAPALPQEPHIFVNSIPIATAQLYTGHDSWPAPSPSILPRPVPPTDPSRSSICLSPAGTATPRTELEALEVGWAGPSGQGHSLPWAGLSDSTTGHMQPPLSLPLFHRQTSEILWVWF